MSLTLPAAAVTPPGLRYAIDVRLDPARHRLDGWQTTVYRSGADSALPAIHLHAYPNAFSGPHSVYGREGERDEDYSLRFTPESDRGWMTIDSVTADGAPASIFVEETIARIDLPSPLAPGDSITLRLHFAVQVPIPFGRFGRAGENYAVAQWYPKVVVYDDLGWHLDPYHYQSEFYGDYGSFDVAITLPDGHWVGATGVAAGVEGGDNDIPLAAAQTSRDSVTVSLSVALADSVAGQWPAGGLEAETDLFDAKHAPISVTVPREGSVTLRVPRGAPVHYSYRWLGGGPGARRAGSQRGAGARDKAGSRQTTDGREEADDEGRPGPLRLIVATRDTSITDTLRALAAEPAPGDTILPSLKTVRFRAEKVHDFAWVASPEYVRSDTTWSGIAVRALVYRHDQEHWRTLAAMTVDALEHHTALVGPYVWPQFTAAETFIGGGAMEYPMLVMNDPDQYSPYFHLLDDTNGHEVGHSWFYGMLGSDERAHAWMDEGFAQYIGDDYTDSTYPDGLIRLAGGLSRLGRYTAFDRDEQRYLQAAWARDEQPIATPADSFRGYGRYAVGSYSKPTCMLHTLRGVLGDSVFVAFLHEYYRRNLLRHPRPADVVKAAEDVSGRDLSAFFREWLVGVERAGFAIGRVRKERTGAGHRSAVTVRRTETMVFPVTVEARFADGSRQEARVTPHDRETVAVFESQAPLVEATLDPVHEMVEMDRLDNRTGRFPPIQLRPLYAVPTSEAIGAAYGPTLWEGEVEGVRLGGWINGSYLPSRDFPMGIRGFEGGLNVGTTNGAVAYRAGAWRRWGALGARSRVRALVVRDEGMFRAVMSAGNIATAPSRLHPYHWWEISLEYRDRTQLPPVDASYWSLDQTVEASATIGVETCGPRRLERAELTFRRGALSYPGSTGGTANAQYTWVAATARQTLDLLPRGDLKVTWRVAAGTALGGVPLERQLDIAEDGRIEALRYFYANDRGPLRDTGHFFVAGGGGLRAYAGRAILGQSLLAGSLEVSHRTRPIFLFADIGRVDADGIGESRGTPLSPLAGRTLADAGAGVKLGPVTLTIPFWVDHPDEDEGNWDFRWLFSLNSFSLTRGIL